VKEGRPLGKVPVNVGTPVAIVPVNEGRPVGTLPVKVGACATGAATMLGKLAEVHIIAVKFLPNREDCSD
jgi:hypothetical protein